MKLIIILALVAMLLTSVIALPYPGLHSATAPDLLPDNDGGSLPVSSSLVATTLGRPSIPVDLQNSAQPDIVNGTDVTIEFTTSDFIFCTTNITTSTTPLYHYQVEWWKGNDKIIGWTSDERRFTVGSGIHVPHLYLVFTRFSSDLAATYDCVLLYQGQEVGRASVTVT